MLVDAHLDLAYGARTGRDLTLSLTDLRARDRGPETPMVTLPELREAGVRVAFGTLFAEPAPAGSVLAPGSYRDAAEARAEALAQLEIYERWEDAGELTLLRNRAAVARHLSEENAGVGIVLLMEGADPVQGADDLPFWVSRGVRLFGLAWGRTRYAGGTDAPGPLTPEGRDLVTAMRDLGVTLDVSHLDDASFWEAADLGPRLIASHANSRALVPGNRHLTDAMARAVAASGGVIGLVCFNRFLYAGWEGGERRPASDLARHARHYAALVGWDHVGLGSDLDGGFGRERVPAGLERYADLPRLLEELPPEARAGVAGGNWARWLREHF